MEKKNSCIIVGAGDFFMHKIVPEQNDYVIAADGGYLYLQNQDTRIDMIIGDLGGNDIRFFPFR
jgi:thiamine pyrophosphokinase